MTDDEIYVEMARVFSKKSKCVSHQVGCLIVKDRRIVSNGYNGTPAGYINCNEVFDPASFDRELHHEFSLNYEIHAEMNALLFAARMGISTDGATLYSTLQPCSACLKNIVQAGIRRIVFLDYYDKSEWGDESRQFLLSAGIELVHHIDKLHK